MTETNTYEKLKVLLMVRMHILHKNDVATIFLNLQIVKNTIVHNYFNNMVSFYFLHRGKEFMTID